VDAYVALLAGTYTTTITAQDTREDVIADWELEFTDYGILYLTENGVRIGQTPYVVTQDQIEIEVGPGCESEGTYRWALENGVLTFTLVRDYCAPRIAVLTTHPLLSTLIAAPPKETAASPEDVVGTWRESWSDTSQLNMELNERGSARFYWMDGTTVARDRYSVESGLITWTGGAQGTAVGPACAANPVATYEVFVIREGSQPVALRFVLVGEDHCPDRQEALDGKTLKWVEP
jgi:hypothetical protein